MKKSTKIIWGIVLVAAGIIFALNALNVTNIDIFFDGWWTLFIIIPSVIGLFTDKNKTGSIICLAVGVLLLLGAQDVIAFDTVWRLALPIIVIGIGINLIFGGIIGGKISKRIKEIESDKTEKPSGFAIFSGHKMNYDAQIFEGAELNAIFGGVECDLRGALIERDCVINASAIFGGIDVFLPEGVNVKVSSNSIFGGVSDKKHKNSDSNAVTVYINATCMFGGVDIK